MAVEAAASYQPIDADLTAIAALSTTGLLRRTGAGTADTVDATKAFSLTAFDPATNCATGDGKIGYYVPSTLNGYNITAVHQQAVVAGTTNTQDVQLRRVRGGIGGTAVDVLSTKSTLDSTEAGSDTAATPAVIDASNDDLATGDLLFVDVDAVQTTPAKGLELTIVCTLP